MLYAKSSFVRTHIALCVYYCMIVYFPHDFQASFMCMPTRYIQLMSTTTVGISLEYHMVAWHKNCLGDEHISKYSPGIPTYYHEDGMPRYIRFTIIIIVWWYPGVNLLSLQIFVVHHVEISTGFVYTKCIHVVYFWKTPLHNKYTIRIHCFFHVVYRKASEIKNVFSRFSNYYALRNRNFYWNIHICT